MVYKRMDLQELLASTDILFYDQSWLAIGTKKSLCELLSTITRITELVLQDRPHFRSVSVVQRMSWASNRETTRVEDRAYCLLGLFDVNLPLLYGEGQKAFLRLQQEILRVSDDQFLFAWDSISLFPAFGFLARSPAAFEFAGAIVPTPSVSNIHSFSMTNKGLCNTLPLIVRDEEIIGLLDCRQKGNFSSIAGVRLLQTSNPSVFERDLHSFVRYCDPTEVGKATTHTIYTSGDQPLYTPWEVYKTFILRRARSDQPHDYVFSKAASVHFEWEDANSDTNVVRTVWERALSRCRLAFGLYHIVKRHTWLVLLDFKLKGDGTLTDFTARTVFPSDAIAVQKWAQDHFSAGSHRCEDCWDMAEEAAGFKFKLIEKILLNQNVVVVDVHIPSEELESTKEKHKK